MSLNSSDRGAISPRLALLIAIGALSWAGPLIRLSSAPPLAIASWRMIFSVAILGIFLGARRPEGLERLKGREWLLITLGGTLLAGHFWSWITAFQYTTVANATVLVAMQPIFAATFSALLLAEFATRRQWLGIGVAVAGAITIGWGSISGTGLRPEGPGSLTGDLLALNGACLAAGYFVIGRRLRRTIDLRLYITLVYGVAALWLTLITILSPGVKLLGHARADWVIFLGLAIGPMLIGHTGINYALRYLPAYLANLAVLGESVGATLIAWLLPAIAETPGPAIFLGGALIGCGLLLGAPDRS